MLFPTTLVGSYPQPEWLIDREKLAERFPPRVRAKELWRIPRAFLAEAQDDATLLAIRAQEEAGLDIITDGEIRRESYSNRFATALEGVDIDNPGHGARPLRSSQSGAAHRRQDPARARRGGRGREVPAGAHDEARSRSPCPVRSRCRSRRRTSTTRATRTSWRSTTPPRSTRRSGICSPPAPTSCRSTSPTCRRGRRRRAQYGLKALNRALEGITGTTCVHICFGYAAIIHERPSGYSFLPELAGCSCGQVSIETAQSKLDCSVLDAAARQEDPARRDRSVGHDVETPETVAARIRRALPYVAPENDRRRAPTAA